MVGLIWFCCCWWFCSGVVLVVVSCGFVFIVVQIVRWWVFFVLFYLIQLINIQVGYCLSFLWWNLVNFNRIFFNLSILVFGFVISLLVLGQQIFWDFGLFLILKFKCIEWKNIMKWRQGGVWGMLFRIMQLVKNIIVLYGECVIFLV